VALPLDVVRVNFEVEAARARTMAATLGWEWADDVNALTIRVKMQAVDGQQYVLVGQFDDYKAQPPLLDFEEFDTGAVGTPRAYPKGHDSLFHSTGPCICAPREVHTGWRFGDWITSRENGTDWSPFSTMSGMVTLIHSRLATPAFYKGRMG
jgi:hypothetical protein